MTNLIGYNHKNRAITYSQQKMDRLAEVELQKATSNFSEVLRKDCQDSSALNGMGSVHIMNGEYEQAEKNIRMALKINPTYEAARNDLRLLEDLRNDKNLDELPLQKRPLNLPAH